MSQVAKSASAFVRAFLAIFVLELEDMAVRLVRAPKLAGVHGYRWTVRLGISVDVGCLAWACHGERRFALDQTKGAYRREYSCAIISTRVGHALKIVPRERPQKC
jgi:hypothetical protein